MILEEVASEAKAAKAGGLRYVSDSSPGLRRRRRGAGFSYTDEGGAPLRNGALGRIRSLAIPPAWTDVWICPDAHGHLQATGYDARGRKQYRYHPRWRELRDASKFERMAAFGEALPRIRARVDADLRRKGLPRPRVLATLVHLLDSTGARVGNRKYARENRSFGLATLENRHVRFRESEIRLRYRGKGGKPVEVSSSDPRVTRILRRCRDLPGEQLFQYVDCSGRVRGVDASDVNRYLARLDVGRFSAKDFRTWTASVLALRHLLEGPPPRSTTAARKRALAALDAVAAELHNTRAICRKSYVHPRLIEPDLHETLRSLAARRIRPQRGLRREERLLLAFLEACGD